MARPHSGTKKRTRKIITQAAVFLLLGAIVNVAVAWGCSIWSRSFRFCDASDSPASLSTWWSANRPFKPLDEGRELDAYDVRLFGVQMSVIGQTSRIHREPVFAVAFRVRAGLPLPAIEGTEWHKSIGIEVSGKTREWRRSSLSLEALGLNQPKDELTQIIQGRFIPLRPLWPGFAINTLFYGGVLWLLFAAPFAIRRRRRVKRGLCPACAYPVGTSEVCTECGARLGA